MFTMMYTAFPDFQATLENLIAEDDRVVVHMLWTGTHQGEFMGIPPTGRRMSINVIDILRVADGKFVEHWGVSDMMGLMQQLGVSPE
jgi:predicted ester cyclase